MYNNNPVLRLGISHGLFYSPSFYTLTMVRVCAYTVNVSINEIKLTEMERRERERERVEKKL